MPLKQRLSAILATTVNVAFWPNPGGCRNRRRVPSRVDQLRHRSTRKGHPIVLVTDIRFIISAMIELSAAMNQDSEPLQPSAIRTTVAYWLSVTAATTYMTASWFPRVIAQRALDGLLYPLWQTVLVLLSDCGLIVVIWLPAAFFSALPCVLLNLLAADTAFEIRFFTFLWDVV